MKQYELRPEPYVASVRCDRCGVEARPDEGTGFGNMESLEFSTGWGSAFGDGNEVAVDLCHACLKETLGPWMRVSTARWARPHTHPQLPTPRPKHESS